MRKILRQVFSSAAEPKVGYQLLLANFIKTHGREPINYKPSRYSDLLFKRLAEISEAGNPLLTALTDKMTVRSYVSERVGFRYLVPLIWSGANPHDIPFDYLPSDCVIKTNHGSGGHIRWRKDRDRAETIASLRTALKTDHSALYGEHQYQSIKPTVMIEHCLSDGNDLGPLDYRFFCFDGEPRVIQVDDRDHSINPFYDPAWTKLDLRYRDVPDVEIAAPPHLGEMMSVARALSAGFDFVRVDLYDADCGVTFGEMTFTPGAGLIKFAPDEWDERLGYYWDKAREDEAFRRWQPPN